MKTDKSQLNEPVLVEQFNAQDSSGAEKALTAAGIPFSVERFHLFPSIKNLYVARSDVARAEPLARKQDPQCINLSTGQPARWSCPESHLAYTYCE